MKRVNKDLKKYIEENIFQKYDKFYSHGMIHINNVIEKYREGRFKKIVLCGGTKGISNTTNNTESEASRFKKMMIATGIPETSIYLEEQSQNTFENIDNAMKIIKDGVTPIHLIWKYKSSLPIDAIELLSSETVITDTLNEMGYKRELEPIEKDVKYYISKLEEMIKASSSKMNLEKYIELRTKLYELIYIDIATNKTENPKENKSLIKTRIELERKNYGLYK